MRVRRPSHDKDGGGDSRGAEHGVPEAEFGGQTGAALGADARQVAVRADVHERYEETGAAEADADAEEGEARQALGEAVGFGEDEGVAVEECEEDDVDDGQVEGDEHDDGFAGGEDEGAVEGVAEAVEESLFADFDFGSVAVVAGKVPEVLGFPFQ